MNHRRQALVLILLCLFFPWAAPSVAAIVQESVPDISEYSDELGQDFAEEHEANGPEGGRQIPVQRLPLKGDAFVLLVLAMSAGVMFLDKYDGPSKRQK